MRLKEAQLLGILAVIALGGIILCMWGGRKDGEPETDQWAEVERRMTEEEQRKTGIIDIEGTGTEEENETSRNIDEQEASEIDLEEEQESFVDIEKEPIIHVVQKNETLIGISRKYYGTGARWKLIHEANRDLIPDPRRDLRPKMKLLIPPAEGTQVGSVTSPTETRILSAPTPAPGTKYYDVQKGDTLWAVARKFYDDPSAWKKIREANSDLIKDENDLRPNMRLIIP